MIAPDRTCPAVPAPDGAPRPSAGRAPARVGFAAITVSAASVQASVPLSREGNPGQRVRHIVRDAIALATTLDPSARELLDDVLLIASEMVANAVRHGGGAAEARFLWDTSGTTIEVDDHSPVLPRQRPAGERGGYGLCLIEAITDAWGCVPHADGKTVRAHFRAVAHTPSAGSTDRSPQELCLTH